MRSKAATVAPTVAPTVAGYLAELPVDRREAMAAVREVILRNLDRDYEEGMSYGMIGYAVPHRVFPAGYHCDPRQPLPFAGLASQKGHMSIYLMSAYGDAGESAWLQERFAKAGKKLDMGKCCIRFKRLEDLPLEVIGEAIKRVPAKVYIERYEKALQGMGKKVRSIAAPAQRASAPRAGTAASRSAKTLRANAVDGPASRGKTTTSAAAARSTKSSRSGASSRRVGRAR
jgi:hypothetical protein